MQKLKICDGCDKERVIWKRHLRKGYCRICWDRLKPELLSAEPKPTVVRQPLARVSDKRAKEERIYSAKRIIFLSEHSLCQIKLPGICTGQSTDVHHTYSGKDKASHYLDVPTWLALCRACHQWVTDHPKESRELGYLK